MSYRNQQTFEERFYAASVQDSMTDITSHHSQNAGSSIRGSARGHGETSGAIERFLFGCSVDSFCKRQGHRRDSERRARNRPEARGNPAHCAVAEIDQREISQRVVAGGAPILGSAPFAAPVESEPIPEPLRAQAIKSVDSDLMKEGNLNENGQLNEARVFELGFEHTSSLPTPVRYVRSCLDGCDVCEPALDQAITLEVDRKRLENALLQKQSELFEKHQNYRACPTAEPMR